jgi:hypothetical protein
MIASFKENIVAHGGMQLYSSNACGLLPLGKALFQYCCACSVLYIKYI